MYYLNGEDYKLNGIKEEYSRIFLAIDGVLSAVLCIFDPDGDGVNDSPALSEADVGVAIDSGAAIAREIADITIASENINGIIMLRKISAKLMNRIKGNYRFIVGFFLRCGVSVD